MIGSAAASQRLRSWTPCACIRTGDRIWNASAPSGASNGIQPCAVSPRARSKPATSVGDDNPSWVCSCSLIRSRSSSGVFHVTISRSLKFSCSSSSTQHPIGVLGLRFVREPRGEAESVRRTAQRGADLDGQAGAHLCRHDLIVARRFVQHADQVGEWAALLRIGGNWFGSPTRIRTRDVPKVECPEHCVQVIHREHRAFIDHDGLLFAVGLRTSEQDALSGAVVPAEVVQELGDRARLVTRRPLEADSRLTGGRQEEDPIRRDLLTADEGSEY